MFKISSKTIAKILIIGLMVALVPSISSGYKEEAKTKQQISTTDSVVLQVVKATPFQSVVVNTPESAVFASACALDLSTSTNLVQDTGLVNLNQPQQCFSLRFGQVITQQQLAVFNSSSADVQIVVTKAGQNLVGTWNPFNLPVQIPSLPATASAAALLMFAALGFAVTAKKGSRLFSYRLIKQELSFSQLGMMRC